MKMTNQLKLTLGALFLVVVLGVLFSGKASTSAPVSSTPAPSALSSKPDYSIWRSMLALGLVLGGLTAVNWYLKHRAHQPIGAKGARRLRVIERLPVDQKRCLLLVTLDGKEFLVGVGNDQISILHGAVAREAAIATEGAP